MQVPASKLGIKTWYKSSVLKQSQSLGDWYNLQNLSRTQNSRIKQVIRIRQVTPCRCHAEDSVSDPFNPLSLFNHPSPPRFGARARVGEGQGCIRVVHNF